MAGRVEGTPSNPIRGEEYKIDATRSGLQRRDSIDSVNSDDGESCCMGSLAYITNPFIWIGTNFYAYIIAPIVDFFSGLFASSMQFEKTEINGVLDFLFNAEKSGWEARLDTLPAKVTEGWDMAAVKSRPGNLETIFRLNFWLLREFKAIDKNMEYGEGPLLAKTLHPQCRMNGTKVRGWSEVVTWQAQQFDHAKQNWLKWVVNKWTQPASANLTQKEWAADLTTLQHAWEDLFTRAATSFEKSHQMMDMKTKIYAEHGVNLNEKVGQSRKDGTIIYLYSLADGTDAWKEYLEVRANCMKESVGDPAILKCLVAAVKKKENQ